MDQPVDRILLGSRVVLPEGEKPAALWIYEGKTQRITAPDAVPEEALREDVGERVIMPGLVDTHVHINEPGRTEWEGFETATSAAAAGGITALVDMPLNSDPVTTSLAALKTKLAAAEGKLRVDTAFWGGVVPGNAHELQPMAGAGVRGFKCFLIHSGIDDFPNVTEADLREAMPVLAKLGLPLLVHAELDCGQPVDLPEVTDARSYRHYLASRPRRWELDAIALMIRLCRETGCPVHIVHLSCADALPMLQAAREEGLPVTVETCSHYLCLAAEDVPEGDTRYKCAPPIRERENADRLWQGLADGVIDFIISDHSPCTPELKLLEEGDFMAAWGGISGLQFGLPLIWTEARRRGYNLGQITRWLSEAPARFAGLSGKGAIAVGKDADFVIWQPEAPVAIQRESIHHRHKVTPYEGMSLQGRVQQTWLRGSIIYNDGRLGDLPLGQPLLQAASTPAVTG